MVIGCCLLGNHGHRLRAVLLLAIALVVLALPGAALAAAAPSVQSHQLTPTTATSETLPAEVDPEGLPTSYFAEYDLESSAWCQDEGGSDTTATYTTAGVSLPETDSDDHAVTVDVTGLTAGTQYCAAVAATNGAGTNAANPTDFTAGLPTAEVDQVQTASATSETVDGQIDPAGQATHYVWEYGPATSTWCHDNGDLGTPANTTSQEPLGEINGDPDPVTTTLTAGLTAGTSYCVTLVATNGTGNDTFASFTSFIAGAPVVRTGETTPTSGSTATLTGEVDPGGQTTTYYAEYDLASSPWCENNGSSGTATYNTKSHVQTQAGSSSEPVTVDLTGLTSGTAYCAELVAMNGSGSSDGGFSEFTAGLSSAQTDQVEVTSATTATVSGEVDPTGQTTTYDAEYDLASSAWCQSDGGSGTPANTTPSQTLAATDATDHDVSVDLTGLTAGTQYCVAIAATNASGTTTGGTDTFTAGAPLVDTDQIVSDSATTATLSGDVDPSGQSTTYDAEYDKASSMWCQSGGDSGTPADTTAPVTLPETDTTYHDVSIDLTGLAPGAYCATVAATNASGTGAGSLDSFTAGAPSVQTFEVDATSATAASVSGDVDPGGQATTYYAEYDLASSAWCESNGQFSAPADNTMSVVQMLGPDSGFDDATVAITGLSAGTQYCAAIVATNPSGASTGAIESFTAGVPGAETFETDATSARTATVSGDVDPAGQATTYYADYDLASSEWCESYGDSGTPADNTMSVVQTLGADSSYHNVTVDLNGLSAGTQYCAAIVATNGSGTTTGDVEAFTAGAPGAELEGEPQISGPSAVALSGSVDPAGQSTTYFAQYGPASSDWCQSDGDSGTPAGATTPVALPQTDATYHDVTVDVSGLTPGTEYCMTIAATNGSATSVSGTRTVTPDGVPSVVLGTPASTGTTGETLNGRVDPDGLATTYQFAYAASGSSWCTSGGASGTPTSTATESAGAGGVSVAVTASLTGLTASTGYCYALSAANSLGASPTPQGTFTTAAPPTVTTPTNTGTTPPAKVPAPTCVITLRSSAVLLVRPKLKKGAKASVTDEPDVLLLRAKCDQAASVTLTGVITERIKKSRRKKASTKRFTMRATGSLVANTALTLVLKLPSAAVAALRAGKPESAAFVLSAHNAHGSATAGARAGALRADKA
jgi:phosphodiesterase/alkaline phosphatase D-like protein